MTPPTPPRRTPCLALAAALFAAGCGWSGTTTVEGTVTYRGKPVVSGGVSLVAADGVQRSGPLKPDGTFRIPDVPVGPVKVGVSSPNPSPPPPPAKSKGIKLPPGTTIGGGRPEAPPSDPTPGWVPIPERFVDPVTSGLTQTVEKGKPLELKLE